MKSLRTGVQVLMKLTLREETKVSDKTLLEERLTRFNELWLNGISKWLNENKWTKEEDEV